MIQNNETTISRYIGDETDLIIPNTIELNEKTYKVTSIGKYAFYECTSLTSITIPNSVTAIGDSAFERCTSLIYCEVTSKPNEWSSNWNHGCPVYYGITKDNKVEQDGIIYVIQNNEAIVTEYVGNDISLTIPNNIKFNGKTYKVTTIGYDAFRHCTSLKSVTISSSVTAIGGGAFGYCTSLISVTIPSSVITIGARAFVACNLLTIYCEATSQPAGWSYVWLVDEIPVYYGITKDNKVEQDGIIYVIQNNEAIVTEYVGNDISLTIPNNIEFNGKTYKVTTIGKYAFRHCLSLSNIIIASNVTTIRDYAFSGCTSLENVYYEGTIKDWCNLEFNDEHSNPMSYAKHFYMLNSNNEYEEVTSIEIPDTVTSIGDYQFYGFNNVTSITIPSSVTTIGDYAFSWCTSLTSIVIPSSVTAIGDGVFKSCTSLTSIKIPSSVTTIESFAFADCTSLTSIVIPSSVTTIGRYAFSGCTSLTSITIPSSVTTIGDYAFSWCTSLTSIVIPSSVNIIGNWAFSGCTSLTIYCEAASKPSSSYCWDIDERPAYYGITKDNKIEKDGIIYVIQNNEAIVTRYVGKDTSLTIPSAIELDGKTYNVTTIGESAFESCTSLTSVTIPSSVTTIGISAFSDCTSLTSVTIPSSVTTIGNWAFEGCTSLTIYCEASSKPSGWNSSWNYSNCEVVWGYNG